MVRKAIVLDGFGRCVRRQLCQRNLDLAFRAAGQRWLLNGDIDQRTIEGFKPDEEFYPAEGSHFQRFGLGQVRCVNVMEVDVC